MLGLQETEVALARSLRSSDWKQKYAFQVLGIADADLRLLKRIRKSGGLGQFISQRMGIDPQELSKLKVWSNLNKIQKIQMLCPNVESIRNFHNLVYTKYLAFKRDAKPADKTGWKRDKWTAHLLKVKQHVEELIVKDEATLDDFFDIGVRLYFACYCWAGANVEKLGRFAGQILPKQQVAA